MNGACALAAIHERHRANQQQIQRKKMRHVRAYLYCSNIVLYMLLAVKCKRMSSTGSLAHKHTYARLCDVVFCWRKSTGIVLPIGNYHHSFYYIVYNVVDCTNQEGKENTVERVQLTNRKAYACNVYNTLLFALCRPKTNVHAFNWFDVYKTKCSEFLRIRILCNCAFSHAHVISMQTFRSFSLINRRTE